MDPTAWRTGWFDREYDTKPGAPASAALIATWPERAAATRAQNTLIEDEAYGAHPRELIDILRAPEPKGCVYYIHGGYWRARSKVETSWVADAFLEAGYSVALLNYPLCPEVSLSAICDSTRRAFAHLHLALLEPEESARIVVVGHSAGGYLAALHLATDWTAYGLPRDPLAGVIPISGIFDLTPLTATSINDQLGLDLAEARRLSLTQQPLGSTAPLHLALGAGESGEFRRQARMLAKHWAALTPTVELAGESHFDILDRLGAGGALYRAAIEMLEKR